MSDILLFIRQFIADSWKFFQITIPGTHITFAMLLIGLGFVNVGFTVLNLLLGLSFPSLGDFFESRGRAKDAMSAHGIGQARLSGSTSYRVAPEREHDTR